MESLSVPPDVRLARTIRALRDAVVGCGAACLGLAVVAAAILALSGSEPALSGPTLTILGGGQLLALVGASVAALGLRGALTGAELAAVVGAVRDRLRWVVRAVLVWSVGAALGWSLAEPGRTVLFLALGAVTAQLAVVVLVLRRRLPR
ncbi:hypothetical protein AA0Y32_12955 [Georgenia phoenicis]|uniref:hypothetical protein n=1 Tax=unclassified Georgenia TaxID=2626815 RepID=UPI0039AFB734